MKELEQFLNVEAEWVLERLSTGTESNDRNYYQGQTRSARASETILRATADNEREGK